MADEQVTNQEKKGTIEDLTRDAEKLSEIGNENFVKSHLLLYGEKVTDSNKLTAIHYDLAKLLPNMHPILDMLTRRKGYREVGWMNLEWIPNLFPSGRGRDPKWLGGKRWIVNEWRGMMTGFAGFSGYVLSSASEDPTRNPQDLYLVRLSYDEDSKGAVKDAVRAELERESNYYLWDSLNLERNPEVVVMVDSASNLTFYDLTEHLRTKAYGGLVGRWGLTGEYQVLKTGRLEKAPPHLFEPASIIKKRERRSCSGLKGVDHFQDPHIDFHSLNANYSIGYELRILDQL